MTAQVRHYPVVLLLAVLLALAGCQRDVAAPSATIAPTTTIAVAGHPNPSITPGVVLTTSRSSVCTPGWASAHRRGLTAAQKTTVLKAYGLRPDQQVAEYDHLIALELGGGNGVKAIWPQLSPDDAKRKDKLEQALHQQVCAGRVDLATAQAKIRQFWRYW